MSLPQYANWAPPLMQEVFLVAVTLALVLSLVLAKHLSILWWLLWGWGSSLGLIVAVTLTPDRSVAIGPCILGLLPVPWIWEVNLYSAVWLNEALFVPLGFFTGLIAWRWPWIIVPVLLVSPVVELVQRVASVIHRTCQLSDVVLNTVGLVWGLLAGLLVAWVAQRVTPRESAPRV